MASTPRARIIACHVFQRALQRLKIQARFPDVQIEHVDSNLHLQPARLRDELIRRLSDESRAEGQRICLYGACAPDIDELCSSMNAVRPQALHCYELFLGKRRFAECLNETAGTFFLEQELIRNFETSCVVPLELDDPWLRQAYFRHYERLLYIRQPGDPNLEEELASISSLLELPVFIREADDMELEEELLALLTDQHPRSHGSR